jgi:stringent starvation protein B
MASAKIPMTSCRPYLINALYTWIVDNHLTPYLIVNAVLPQVQVPQQFVQEGKIILNVAPLAVKELAIEAAAIQFSARFNNIVQQVYVPTAAVLGIYAKENGRGMFFDSPEFLSEAEQLAQTGPSQKEARPKRGKPQLTVVRNAPPEDKS